MKTTKLVTMVMISMLLTACSPKEAAIPVTESGMAIETAGAAASGEEGIPIAVIKDKAQSADDEENKQMAEEIKPEKPVESRPEEKTKIVYEDNFAVETSAAAEFADKIKAAVAAKDIEALADLTAFPVYVGIAEGGVESREAFVALGAEKVFAPELLESVKDADTSNLLPSMAGFSISKDGKSNIIFGVVEGRLAISGINYE